MRFLTLLVSPKIYLNATICSQVTQGQSSREGGGCRHLRVKKGFFSNVDNRLCVIYFYAQRDGNKATTLYSEEMIFFVDSHLTTVLRAGLLAEICLDNDTNQQSRVFSKGEKTLKAAFLAIAL